jgi:hypothetical protein
MQLLYHNLVKGWKWGTGRGEPTVPQYNKVGEENPTL